MPTPDALMAEASPERVLSEASRVMVCAVPLPTCSLIEPDSVSALLVDLRQVSARGLGEATNHDGVGAGRGRGGGRR